MSSVDFTDIELPVYSPADSIFGDVHSPESQSLSCISDTSESCPYCQLSLASLGCDYQEHIQVCAASSTSVLTPKSPSSPSSTSRLIHSIPRYQAKFHGLGLHRRLEMMQSLQRLAQRCVSDCPPLQVDVSPSSPPRKASPTQDLDNKVILMLFTPPSEEKQNSKKRKMQPETPVPSIRPRIHTEQNEKLLKNSPATPLDSISFDSTSEPPPLSPSPKLVDPLSFLSFDRNPQESKAPRRLNTPLEDSGFGISSLSPLDSPSSFDWSLSPPKESLGTTFFLTPSQSTQGTIPKMPSGLEARWFSSQNSRAPFFPSGFQNPSTSGSDSKSQEEVLRYLISQYQILLARTDAFLRGFPLESGSADSPSSTGTRSASTDGFLNATSTIQQLASLSSKRLQESFAQIAKLQDKINQHSPMFQAPNSFRKLSDCQQSLLGLSSLAKAQGLSSLAKTHEQLKSCMARSWGFDNISEWGTSSFRK